MSPRERIRAFIAESFFVEDFADDDSFLLTGIIDSLGMLELVTFVEREYGFKVQDDELTPDNFDSLARIEAFIERTRASRDV